jgi:acyl-CoA thioesterase FadM
MHFLLRTLLIFFERRWMRPARFSEVTRYSMRVLPTDLDLLMHVNNGVYFSYMDFGRWAMIFRTGVYALSRRKGWYSVVSGESIKFRKSLKLWDKFTMETQVCGHDEKYFFVHQTFLKGGEIMAKGLVRVRFLKVAGGTVSPAEVMAEFDEEIPEVSELGREWLQFEDKFVSGTDSAITSTGARERSP